RFSRDWSSDVCSSDLELETSKDYETLYIDLLATQNMDEAIQAISSGIYEKYGKTSTGISAAIQKLFASIGATISFNSLSGTPEKIGRASCRERGSRSE